MNVFVGRQPILDVNEKIFGYELLYRNSEKNFFPTIDPNQATIGLLVNTFLSIGIDNVVGNCVSFINFTGELLAQDLFSSLNPDQVIVEILEDVEITPSLISKLYKLKNDGFKLALDDFILQEQYQIHTNLFNLIDYIKVDFLHTTLIERHKIENFAKKHPHIAMLAEKIETKEEFLAAKKSGYTLFQGYFFSKPEIIKRSGIPSNANLHLHIINQITKDTPNIGNIADLIMHDVSLSYKMLRFINTLAFGVPKQINSIKQAIVIIGLRETKKWMYVLALQEIGTGTTKNNVKALIEYSLTRAKMCELLAKKAGKKNADEYFLAGMFSLIDVIMNQNWEDILTHLPLSNGVAHTLTGQKTEITPYLELTKAVERFDWVSVARYANEINIDSAELSKFTQQANCWAQCLE
ncbi:HDOD domain-containing protein [Filibacter tadaridae]|uniref:HDOD domain protein n=1 Tax=Filibacter tadaridae TaxID=2483811 RepID=A0A3P5WK34_9BACL|nr:HDOD domain-containing protein [Filibacter tadaridae]VDC24013.1 HDOD domain protein [Filibacter tadaridae]